MQKSSLAVFIVLMIACIDPVLIPSVNTKPMLVVEGQITNQPGPYQVKVFHTTKTDTSIKNYLPESMAQVIISDSNGQSELLTEVQPGTYETSAGGLQGVIGNTYSLRIVTKDGKEYESLPETMQPNGAIDSIYYEYTVINTKNPDPSASDISIDGFNFFVNAHGTNAGNNFYRWRWQGTYKVKTYPEMRVKSVYLSNGREGEIADPVPCSGYKAVQTGPLSAYLVQTGACECCVCWINDFESKPFVSDTHLVINNLFTRVGLGFIRITNERFYEKYYFSVTQMSLTKNALDFWKAIKTQKESTGNLFQPSSGKIPGNITSTDGTEEVQGIFYASAIDEKDIYIYPAQVPRKLDLLSPKDKTYQISCLDYTNSSTTQPPFWK